MNILEHLAKRKEPDLSLGRWWRPKIELKDGQYYIMYRITAGVTQVVEGLGAGGIVPQCFFVELCGLFVVLFDEHGAALVDECRWVVAIGGHGEISVAVRLVKVLLL